MPRISVVVPVYKVERYLRRCIDSILTQTYRDFELILIDDGSPDNCGKICEEFAVKDNRVRVFHRKNGGLSAARNTGIDWAINNSDSEWITFIDSDDFVHPLYLELLYKAVTNSGIPLSLVNFERTTGRAPDIGTDAPEFEIIDTPQLYKNNYMQFITAWGKLYLKSDFRNLRYPEGKLHEDEFTTWKILFKYPHLTVYTQPLYGYFVNAEGITKAKWNDRRPDGLQAQIERIEIIEKNPSYSLFYEQTLRITAGTMAGYIETLQKSNYEQKQKAIAFYRKKLKSFLREYKKYIPFRGYGWVYGKAYPNLIKYFILFADTSDKIKTRLGKK